MNQSLNATDYFECEATNAILTLGVRTLIQAEWYFTFNKIAATLLLISISYFIWNLKDKVGKFYLSATSLLWIAYTIICIALNYFTIRLCLTKNSYEFFYMFRIFTFTVSIYSYLSLLVDILKERYPNKGDIFFMRLPSTYELLRNGFILAILYCISYYLSRKGIIYNSIAISPFICLGASIGQIYLCIKYTDIIKDLLHESDRQDQETPHFRWDWTFNLIFIFIFLIAVLQMVWNTSNRLAWFFGKKSIFERLRESCFDSGCLTPII